MEISVVDVENVPPGCLLSLGPNGASKRQAPLVPQQKFAWRTSGSGDALKVDILSVLGSTQLGIEDLCALGSGGARICDLHIPLGSSGSKGAHDSDDTAMMRVGLSIHKGPVKHRPVSPPGAKSQLLDLPKLEENAAGVSQRSQDSEQEDILPVQEIVIPVHSYSLSTADVLQRCQDAEQECARLREQLKATNTPQVSRELLSMRDERNKWKDECSKLQLELACGKLQPGYALDDCSRLQQEVMHLKGMQETSQGECDRLRQEVARLKDVSELCETLKQTLAENRDKLDSEERRVQERDDQLKELRQIERLPLVSTKDRLLNRQSSWPSAVEPKTAVSRPPTASASRGCRLQPEPEAEASRPSTAGLFPGAMPALRHSEVQRRNLQLEPEAEASRPSTAGMWPGVGTALNEPEAEASRPTTAGTLKRPMSAAGSRGRASREVWGGRVNPRWNSSRVAR